VAGVQNISVNEKLGVWRKLIPQTNSLELEIKNLAPLAEMQKLEITFLGVHIAIFKQ
jgi:hypothetical protein